MNTAQKSKPPLTPAQQQRMVDRWNAKHPLRIDVFVRLDDGSIKRTKTVSKAWLLGGHTAVILVEGISGAYSLARVTAADPGAKEAAA
jgi:hypothetical protein